jgi:TonB-linked SusC/RagA family outer membrane protein
MKQNANSFIKRFRTVIVVLFLCTLPISAQDVTVTGTILDQSGEPLIGVTIIEEGTGNGVISNVDGTFSMMVSSRNANLIFSFLGYQTQEINLSGKTSINVTMRENSELLNEVIVVGYGVQKKGSVTGSIASIQSKDLETTKTASVTNALAGKLPGLRAVQRSGAPGDDAASIDIRGFGSALVIVDGIERSFNEIDANDIESISVLKDASASVYGFKGANGVILVTTKKGQQGKAKISYNGFFGLQKITRYPNLLNGYDYATLYNEGQLNIGGSAPYSDEQLTNFRNGVGCTNWYKETIRSAAPMQSHNLSVSGGSEKFKYFFSLGYLGQEGMYRSKDLSYDRYNVRSNLSAKLSKGLTIDLQLSGRLDSRQKPREDEGGFIMRSIQMALPTIPIYANNNPAYYANPGDKGNPVQNSFKDQLGYDNRDRRVFNGSLAVTWDVPWVKGLSAKGLFSYDYSNTETKAWYKEYYAYAYDDASDTYNKSLSHTLSTLTQRSRNYFRPNGQLSLNYNNTFGNHDLGMLLLYEFYNDHNDWIEAYREFAISAIDQINAGSKTNINNGGTTYESAHKGLVGRLNYAYANKYLVELSFRYDGSYKFDPDKRWGFFPAISLGWRVSEESFFKDNLSMFDNLKIRGSYGKIGDEGDFSAFQYLQGYTYPSGSYVLGSGGVTNGARDTGMPNTNLTWYKSKTFNIGFEASIYRGLLSVEFDYFMRNREGLLATRQLTLPTTFGQALPQENLNSDKTKGWEILLGHNNKIGEFTYNIRANFSTTRNYNKHVERAALSNMYDNWRNNSNDRVKNITWGYVALGQFQSYEEILNSPIQDGNGNKSVLPGDIKYEDWNNDGLIDSKDQQPIGRSSTPQMYYGLNLSGEYHSFDMTLFLQGAAGHHIFTTGDIMYPFIQQGLGNGLEIWMDRWHLSDATDPSSEWISGEMPAIRVAGYSNNALTSTWTRHNGTYLRLKTVELGYTLPKSWLDSWRIDRLRVYVNALNLLTFSSREGVMKYMDPENNSGAFRYYPQQKTFNFGVNLTF